MLLFHDATEVASQGKVIDVAINKTLSITIYGTATARTVNFYTVSCSNELIPILGFNISTADLANTTSGTTTEIWQFDVTALGNIVMAVSAISGGNLTIKGTVVI
jgi:hypothetical protein